MMHDTGDGKVVKKISVIGLGDRFLISLLLSSLYMACHKKTN